MSSPCSCNRVFITSGIFAVMYRKGTSSAANLARNQRYLAIGVGDLQTVTAAHPARPPHKNVSPRLNCCSAIAGLPGATGTAEVVLIELLVRGDA